MALISIIKDFHPHNYAKLLDKAAELAPPLHHSIAEPVGGFKLKERYSPEKEEIVLRAFLTWRWAKERTCVWILARISWDI